MIFFVFSKIVFKNSFEKQKPKELFGSCFGKVFSVLKNKENREKTFASLFFLCSKKHRKPKKH